MKILNIRTLSSLSLLAAALSASAQTSFYGGDFDGVNGLSSEIATSVGDARVYDDFTLGAATDVQSVFGNFLTNAVVTGLYYEIRQGVAPGNGGSLLFSGTLAATAVDTGIDGFGFNLINVSGNLSGVTLASGDYFLSVAVVGNGGGRAFLATTAGSNAVGSSTVGNSYFDSTSFGTNFATVASVIGSDADFSLGVNGTAASAVPGPAALTPFLMGGLATLRRRRRKA